jgi:hypothetical protein
MEFILLFIQIPLLIFLIKYLRKKNQNSLLVNSYYYLLSFKVTAGLFLGVLYFNYYKGGDTISYLYCNDYLSQLFYSDLKEYVNMVVLNNVPPELEQKSALFAQPRAFNFIRLINPVYILSGSNYWMLSIYLSFFSFAGLWILSDTLLRIYKLKPLAVMISFFIFPTVVFWTSGVIKESLVIGMMSFIISLVILIANKKKKISVLSITTIIIFSMILLSIKFYYLAVLMVVLLPYGIVKYFSEGDGIFAREKKYRIGALLFLIIMIGFSATFIHPKLNIGNISKELYINYSETKIRSTETGSYTFKDLSPEPTSFLPYLPTALSYGLFGPYLWQCKKIISLISGIENTAILILFITFLLANFKKEKIIKADLEEVSVIIYVMVLAVFMAFASPNWGSLVRYKVGYLPFFLLLILNSNPFILQLEKRFAFLNFLEKKS